MHDNNGQMLDRWLLTEEEFHAWPSVDLLHSQSHNECQVFLFWPMNVHLVIKKNLKEQKKEEKQKNLNKVEHNYWTRLIVQLTQIVSFMHLHGWGIANLVNDLYISRQLIVHMFACFLQVCNSNNTNTLYWTHNNSTHNLKSYGKRTPTKALWGTSWFGSTHYAVVLVIVHLKQCIDLGSDKRQVV